MAPTSTRSTGMPRSWWATPLTGTARSLRSPVRKFPTTALRAWRDFEFAQLTAARSDAQLPIARGTPAPDLWSKGRRFEMTETLARPVVPAAEERARPKEGVHIERSSRRVRTYLGGKLIADSEHVLLVYETKRPPAYWFPIADVRMEYLEQSQQAADTIRSRLVVKDRIAHNAARTYIKSTGDRP